MQIGAHVSSAGGVSKAIDRGLEIGCEAIQLFGSSARGWSFKMPPDKEIAAFKQRRADTGMGAVFFHAIYLINLGSPNPDLVQKGVHSLTNYMQLAAALDADGVVFHPGSHKGQGFPAVFDQVVRAINQVLDDSPAGPYLCLENMAGMGQHIGARFEELGQLLQAVDNPRLRICLDTQHSFAAGYDLTTPAGVAAMIDQFNAAIGPENLAAVHANDSKQLCGSGVDRHDNIGEGYIGEAGFACIMAHPAFQQAPFFLEVPGFNGNGPDAQNIQILKSLRSQAGLDN